MYNKSNMNIIIFRNTVTGNVECEGELFECHGLQFCLTVFDGLLNAIELSTGFRSDSVAIGNECYERIKKRISNRKKKSYEVGLNSTKSLLEVKCIPFPVNRPIIEY